jgi:hypothetical protein
MPASNGSQADAVTEATPRPARRARPISRPKGRVTEARPPSALPLGRLASRGGLSMGRHEHSEKPSNIISPSFVAHALLPPAWASKVPIGPTSANHYCVSAASRSASTSRLAPANAEIAPIAVVAGAALKVPTRATSAGHTGVGDSEHWAPLGASTDPPIASNSGLSP